MVHHSPFTIRKSNQTLSYACNIRQAPDASPTLPTGTFFWPDEFFFQKSPGRQSAPSSFRREEKALGNRIGSNPILSPLYCSDLVMAKTPALLLCADGTTYPEPRQALVGHNISKMLPGCLEFINLYPL